MVQNKKTHFLSISGGILVLFVFLNVCFLFTWFGKNMSPKFVHLAELNLNRHIDQVASDFKAFSLEKNQTDQFLIVKENAKGEITAIDYDYNKIYGISRAFTSSIQDSIEKSTIKSLPYFNQSLKDRGENGLLLEIPMGAVGNNIFLVNLGPKIPVYIHFIGSLLTQVKTKVTDYGINNALLDVYLKVKITYEIVTPLNQEEKVLEYDLLLDSKVIQGMVPNFYGRSFESASTFFEVPFP